MKVEIWTDGACRNNQHEALRIAGWGCFLYCEELNMIKMFHGKSKNATNNEAELYAILIALQNMKSTTFEIEIFTDSQYAMNTCREWMHTWASKGWGVNKANLDIVKKIYKLWITFPFITISHVRGHSGILGNEICDRLCNLAIDDITYGRHEPIMQYIRKVQLGEKVDFNQNIGRL